ncbi:serine-type D-Ala-D-Ala carboxypeptidase DacD [Escherichia coli]|nr:serine-type D-Ala-D-Ala carboxypeptidase DacD [Escherichia coli]
MKQDIEASVIGGLLIGGLTPTASDVLATLEPEAFSIPLYRKAFEVIRKQARNRNLIDALMVAEACGEEHFTSILMTSKNCPSAANLKGYAGMVADNYHRRLVLEIMDEMREPIQSGTIDASSQAMDELVKRLSAIRKPRDEVKPVRLGEIITDYTDTLDRRLRNGEESDTLKTGIEELDAITGGMNAEDLVIIAARPGMGKTELALKITPDDIVTVGRDAWAKDNPVFVGSSLMFLKEGDRVSVRDLSRGLIVDSGNDACVALADYIAGGQRQFVEMMNNYAEKLHLNDTHFETVHGLDAPGQHSSAYDLAVLSRAIIHGEPEFYHMYSEKSLTWNGITQQNRNGLLWDKTMNVDGLKTGHTSGAGFNLIASAVDGQRRLIAVVMGADSAKGREEEARKLLRWGQQNFTTVQILHRGKKVGTERIWYGDKENIDLGTEQEFWMVLPKAEIPHIKAKYTLDGKELTAPISAHQRVGEIELYDRDKQVAHWPLVTLESVGEGGMFSRLSDYFHHKA